jgi:hypothetical protein
LKVEIDQQHWPIGLAGNAKREIESGQGFATARRWRSDCEKLEMASVHCSKDLGPQYVKRLRTRIIHVVSYDPARFDVVWIEVYVRKALM